MTKDEQEVLMMARGISQSMLGRTPIELLQQRWPQWHIALTDNGFEVTRKEPAEPKPLPHITPEGAAAAKTVPVGVPANSELAGAQAAAAEAAANAPNPLLPVS